MADMAQKKDLSIALWQQTVRAHEMENSLKPWARIIR